MVEPCERPQVALWIPLESWAFPRGWHPARPERAKGIPGVMWRVDKARLESTDEGVWRVAGNSSGQRSSAAASASAHPGTG